MTMAAVESIPCPRCAAAPGQQCTTPGGLPIPTGHATRWVTLFSSEAPRSPGKGGAEGPQQPAGLSGK